jgi:N-acetylglucosamine-6-phosphate deacetylase
LGAHLEGPYINPEKKGAQPEEFCRPLDVRECLDLCGDVVKIVTLAPEMENGLDLVDALVEEGISPSIGHSDATYDLVCAACERGARSVTHGFNAMRGLHHREPGVIGAAMALREMRVEIIADLVHVHPGAIRALWNAKGDRHLTLISDCMRAGGQPDGEYELGGQLVIVRGGTATLVGGNLAGSISNLCDEVRNLVHAVGMPLSTAVRIASANPADRLCLQARKGYLAPGADADFVALDADLNVAQTVIRGEVAYTRET